MKTYKANRAFRGKYGQQELAWDEGDSVLLEPDVAAWVCQDLGDPEALVEVEQRAVKKPPRDRMMRDSNTRSNIK